MENILKSVLKWQQLACPTPNDKSKTVALGVHIEEIAEMFAALGAHELATPINTLATACKTGQITSAGPLSISHFDVNRKELLDALCDQIVTAVGLAYRLNLDIITGMQRVDASNWSKFVDGQPAFDANGKVKKGPHYVAPNLEGLYEQGE